MHPPLYNKNNEIFVKLNNTASSEEMKNKSPEKVANRIDAHLVENDITAIKLYAAQSLPNRDIEIQTTNEKEAKKLKREDGCTRVLGSKAKGARKRYGIVVLGIPIAKIDIEKPKEIKEEIVTQNAKMCAGMKIEIIFLHSKSKKDRRTSSLVVEMDDAKIANMLIEEGLVLDHTLHGCMRDNPACKMKQYFNCYKYGHVWV